MRISKIEFENFRNFKDHGEIKCSTDGKVTLIYGKNGDGKTTLHQLFQWILYGQVNFNRTASDRLYNLQYESELSYGDVFNVMGRIDFEHDNSLYSVMRVNTYKKGLDDSEKIAEDFSLSKMDDDNNWRRVDRPREIIEKLLPSGLSEYFFFDGESMIADLRVKGKDAANKLRKALYSMFDLDVIESAISHIGRIDLKTTVLGKLYLNKGNISSGGQIAAVRTNIENAQMKLESIDDKIQTLEAEKKERQDLVLKISEQIGGSKSKAEYERQRKLYKAQRDIFLKNAAQAQSNFGDAVVDMFPQLLISKAVEDAKAKIHLQVEKTRLPRGLNKILINYLLSESTNECVCGNPLCDAEKQHIKEYLDLLPPKSFASVYQDFSRAAKNWGSGYDLNRIENYIKLVLDNNEQASECDNRVRELDEMEKKSPDIEDLVVARRQAEADIIRIDKQINELGTEHKKYEIYLKGQMKEFDRLTKENSEGEKVLHQINIMEQVSKYYADKLETASVEYSQRLESDIQDLINSMLTSKRTVSVSPEFAVRVTDSFNDESKSEGQFAVVSFAYIGGILKMLQSEESLSAKEYPLVLDGPFSKLDPDQRQNVVNVIPKFAPQVILFSKDDLHDVFAENQIGRVWTIVSNEEKNVARVEEGYLWN